MGKIVILCGSVRHGGNTETLAKHFEQGASKNHQTVFISIADYKVNPCTGCNYCYRNAENQCCQKDDMDEIYQILAQADMIVISSPVYFYGLSARLKAIIDRLHNPIRNTFRVKKLALLLVAADTLPELFSSITTQYQLTLNFFHLQDGGRVLVNGVKDKGDIMNHKALAEAEKLGESIIL